MATKAEPELWEITAYPDNSMDVDATSEPDTQLSEYETRVRWKCLDCMIPSWSKTNEHAKCDPRWSFCGYVTGFSLLGTALALFLIMALVPLHGESSPQKFTAVNCTAVRIEMRHNATCERGTSRSRRTYRYPCVWVTVKYNIDEEDWIETVLYDTDYDLAALKGCSVNPVCSKYEDTMRRQVTEFITKYGTPDNEFPCLVEVDAPQLIVLRRHQIKKKPMITMVIPGIILIVGLGLIPLSYWLGGDLPTIWKSLPLRRRIGSATYRVQL